MQNQKRIVFISSRQDELQIERNSLRDFINKDDPILSKLFIAKTFEHDLAGRRESVQKMIEEWVLKSDVYLGIFDKEYSSVVEQEYHIVLKDRIVKKEIIIFIRKRQKEEREGLLSDFLSKIMDSTTGHSCKLYDHAEDLIEKVKVALMNYKMRTVEGFIISKEILGPNLDKARNSNFSEKLRRRLLLPIGRHRLLKGRKGIYEDYVYDENGDKIDVT